MTSDFSTGSGSAKVWDAATGEVLLDLFHEDFAFGVDAVVWSSDGTRIASFSEDKLGRIWDAATGEELIAFPGPSGVDPDITWSPSGDRFLTGGLSSAAKIWDANTGIELLNLDIGKEFSASWSPDGTLIAISAINGDLIIFPAWQTLEELVDFACECCVFRELTPEERVQFGLPEIP